MSKKNKKQTIGATLKQNREKLKLDIDSISKKLNIKSDIIRYLEEENWHLINKNLYLTGLILSYAKILMIDSNIINQKLQDLNIESNTQNKKHQLLNIGEDPNLTPNKNLFHASIFAGPLLIIIFTAIFNINISKENIINYPKLYKEINNENQ